MDTRINNTWVVGPTENGYWQVLWPKDMWSPIREFTTAKKLWDLVFEINQGHWGQVGFYMETDSGSMVHYISQDVYHQQAAEIMIDSWMRRNAEIWGVCYQSREAAEKFHDELDKRYTWYLLKSQE